MEVQYEVEYAAAVASRHKETVSDLVLIFEEAAAYGFVEDSSAMCSSGSLEQLRWLA